MLYFNISNLLLKNTNNALATATIGVDKIIPSTPQKCPNTNNATITVTGLNFIVRLITIGCNKLPSIPWIIKIIINTAIPIPVPYEKATINAGAAPI